MSIDDAFMADPISCRSSRRPFFQTSLLAPAKTPRAIVMKLNSALNEILSSTESKEKLTTIGVSPSPSTPEKFAEQLKTDLVLFGQVVKAAGVRSE